MTRVAETALSDTVDETIRLNHYETISAEHQLSLPEMFHIISKMEANTANDIFHELDQTYKTVLDFVHELQDALEEDPEFYFSGVCEADEVSVVVGEKGTQQASPRKRGLNKKGRGTFESGKPPVVTLVRRERIDTEERETDDETYNIWTKTLPVSKLAVCG